MDFSDEIIEAMMKKGYLEEAGFNAAGDPLYRITELFYEEQAELVEEIKKIEINSMENAHSKIEYSGEKLISCRTFEDFKFIEQTNSIFDAIMFLCFQYFSGED